jgi:hypothetical protein
MEADPSWGQHRAMRPTLERALVMLLLAASIGACGTTIDLHKRAVQGVIDGQEVGALACGPGAFGPLGEPLCGRFIDLARTQLDREQPGHVAIRDVEVYRDPAFAGYAGGPWVVVVHRLDDGMAPTHRLYCPIDPINFRTGCRPELTVKRKGTSPPAGRP